MLTEAFGWVIKTSIMAGILAIVILFARYIFKDKLGAKWHFAIWVLLIIRLLIPFSMESPISIYNFASPAISKIEGPMQLSPEAVQETQNSTLNNDDSVLKSIDTGGNSQGIPEKDNTQGEMLRTEAHPFEWRDLFSLIWITVGFILFFLILAKNIIFYLKVKDEPPTEDIRVLKPMDRSRDILHIKKVVPVIISKAVKTPCLFGVFKPKVYLPEVIAREISEENLRYVFLHELSHYKRKDILINWIAVASQVMHWFNPVIWFCLDRMREDCELACDSYALTHLSEDEYEMYGLSIIKLLSMSRKMWVPAATGFFGSSSKKKILRRIKSIKMFKRPKLLWTIAAIAVIICLGIIGLSNSKPVYNTSTGTDAKAVQENTIDPADDSIGGAVKYDLLDYKFSKEFDENFDHSHIVTNGLSIYFMSIHFVPGTLDGEEKDIVLLHMTLYNYSDTSVFIYPEKSYIANKDGKKVSASIINSAKIGGETKPDQFKEGDIVFPMSGDVFADQTEFQFVMGSPEDEKGSRLGDDVVFNIKYSIPVMFSTEQEDLLYGKYPAPILRLISDSLMMDETSGVAKDYTELTRSDLEKVKTIGYWRMKGDYPDYGYYGFKAGTEYDFSILLDMPNLTSLDLRIGSGIRMKDYSVLTKLENLKSLQLSSISDDDIKYITGLTSLTNLTISGSSITNINFLKDLKQLTSFWLVNTPDVHDLQPLSYLPELNMLSISKIGLTEEGLKGIPALDMLKRLQICDNNIQKITEFPKMKSLTTLVLDDNPLTDVSIPQGTLPNLKSLSLNNTKISDLNNLRGVEGIEEIFIRNTLINTISPLKDYKNLKSIYVNRDSYQDLSELDGRNINIEP